MGRIALVEDNGDTAELIQAVLLDEHTVDWFADATTFFKSFPSGEYELILLDIGLPGTDGYEILTSIRALNPNMPVFVLSAHADPQKIQAAMQRGICDYIVKPIRDIDQFRDKVRRNLGGSARRNP